MLKPASRIERTDSAHIQKIGYVVKRYPRFSETFIVNEVLAHEKAGLNLEIFSLRPPVDTHFQDIISQVKAPVHYLSSRGSKASAFWRMIDRTSKVLPDVWDVLDEAGDIDAIEIFRAMDLAQKIVEKKIGHLHAHFATSAATVARLAAKMAGVPYSVTMHAKDIFHHTVKPIELAMKIQDAKFVVTVSDFNLNFLRETYNADNIHRIYNGMDLEQFQFQPPGDRQHQIIAVGRLVEKKGFADLIAACRLLKDKGHSFNCCIVGEGELRDQLQQQIVDTAVQDCVTLVGSVPQNQLRQMVHQSSVLVAPCVVTDDGDRDGLPTVITESLALGTPCIATDVTGIPEIVRDGETGLVVQQHCPETIAKAIKKLWANQTLSKKLAEQGRCLVETEFNVATNARQLRSLIGLQRPRMHSRPTRPRVRSK